MQIRSITKEKGSLEEKYCKTKNDASLSVTHVGNVHVKESVFLKNDATTPQYSKQLKETVTESSATSFQVGILVDFTFSYLSYFCED